MYLLLPTLRADSDGRVVERLLLEKVVAAVLAAVMVCRHVAPFLVEYEKHNLATILTAFRPWVLSFPAGAKATDSVSTEVRSKFFDEFVGIALYDAQRGVWSDQCRVRRRVMRPTGLRNRSSVD